jgi:hypothetical protein
MFKAYKEPPKPAYDWTDMLVEKGIPLLGAGAGAVIGGLVAPGVGIAPGMAIGSGLGNMVSGLVSEKPTSEAKMGVGMKGAMKGYQDWEQIPPEKKLDTNDKGNVPGAATAPASISQLANPSSGSSTGGYASSYAPNFAKDMYHRKPEDDMI